MAKISLTLIILSSLVLNTFSFSLFSYDPNKASISTGEIILKQSVRNKGMGCAGLALSDSLNYNKQNPASFGKNDYTLISATYQSSITYLEESNNPSTFLDLSDDFPSVELVVSTGKYGTIFTGYSRDEILNYKFKLIDSKGFTRDVKGVGGTYSTSIGYAYSFKKILSLGVSFGGTYGHILNSDFVTNSPYPDIQTIASRLQKTKFSSYNFAGGLIAGFGKFSIGLSGNTPVGNQDIEKEYQIIHKISNTDSVESWVDTIKNDFKFPSISVGLAYSPTKRLDLAVDMHNVFWDNGIREKETFIGGGLELRFSDSYNVKYFKNVPLRAGFYYHDFGYSDNIKEQAITVGFALPTRNNYGVFNFSIEGGRRYSGDTQSTPLLETFSRLSIQFVHKGRWGRLKNFSNRRVKKEKDVEAEVDTKKSE